MGGAAVLGTYVYGLVFHPDLRSGFWGGVPQTWRSVYTVSMFLAAAGYFAYTSFLLFRLDPERACIAGRVGYGLFNVLYALILLGSALWLPLTMAMLTRGSTALWVAIRVTLALVGIASLGLVAALLGLQPREPTWAHGLAVLGSVVFAFQTAVLDALVWAAFFPG